MLPSLNSREDGFFAKNQNPRGKYFFIQFSGIKILFWEAFYAQMINTKHTNAKDCLQKTTKELKLRKYQALVWKSVSNSLSNAFKNNAE